MDAYVPVAVTKKRVAQCRVVKIERWARLNNGPLIKIFLMENAENPLRRANRNQYRETVTIVLTGVAVGYLSD